MATIKKIVIIGPESTGKSSLAEKLAKHFRTCWCPEFAREYLLKKGKIYSYENLLEIAKGQIASEEKKTNSLSPLFIDTDMYVMKVWCEFVFNRCHQFILDEIAKKKYDLYLLCNIDLPWTEDDLREYPEEQPRKELYSIYKDILINQITPWVEISGNYEQRFHQAIAVVKTIIE